MYELLLKSSRLTSSIERNIWDVLPSSKKFKVSFEENHSFKVENSTLL